MLFSLRRAALASAAAVAALPLAAQAGPAAINATQLSVTVAPISISGTRLGGYVDAAGNGLKTGAAPGVDADGSLTAGTTITTDPNTAFNFAVTARSSDQVVTTAAMTAAGLVPTSQFGSQSGKYTATGGTLGTLVISAANAATITAGTHQGSTATAIFSTTMSSAENESQIRRIATSSNDQATFSTERQAARFQAGGSGLDAVTAGGLGTAGVTALGANPAQTALAGGGTQAGVAFTKSQEVRTGQAAAALTADSTTMTQPAYGVFTNTMGGTTAGAITATNMNNLTVLSGGAGTTSTLSVIQSQSAF